MRRLLAFLFLCATFAVAQNPQRASYAVQNNAGFLKVVPNAAITLCVYNTGLQCNATVQIYSNPGLTTPIAYPYYANANGYFSYYVLAGNYVERQCVPASVCVYFQISLGGGGAVTAIIPGNNITCSTEISGFCIGPVTINSSSGLLLQHNGVNLADQALLNFDDTAPAPPTGYDSVTFQTSSGGELSGYVPAPLGIQVQLVPPISGQYAVIYPTTGTITNDVNGNGAIVPGSGFLGWFCYNGLGLCDIVPGSTASWTGFVLPSYINPANVTAVYADAVTSGGALGSPAIPASGGSNFTGLTCTGSGNSLFPATPYSNYVWLLQEVTQPTTLTGSTISSVTCSESIGSSNIVGGSGFAVNVAAVRLIVYYTGTPPPAVNAIKFVPPLLYNASLQTVSVDPNSINNLVALTVASLPLVSQASSRGYLISDGTSATDCATGGGTGLVICYSNGSTWSAYSGGSASVKVNGGSALAAANFNGSTPAAPGQNTNCTWQVSGANVSCYVPTGPADTTITIGASVAFSANTCSSVSGTGGTASTVSMAGLATTMTLQFTPNSDVSAVTGWSPGGAGQLYFTTWPSSAGTASYYVCNPTVSTLTTGGSTTWNVSAH
jgi:hypothetical protein